MLQGNMKVSLPTLIHRVQEGQRRRGGHRALTRDDESALGGREARLAREAMLGATLVRLVAVLGAHVLDV